MNHIYRLVWNQLSRAWVAVAEIAKGCGKCSSVTTTGPSPSRPPHLHILAAALALTGVPAWAQSTIAPSTLPTGGQLAAGAASISQAANVLTVQQTSQRAALDWQSFNIGAAATVNFNQPNGSAIALNRIAGNEASQIYGKLNANGQVFFSNPSGMLFARGAQVNVGGMLATTLHLSNDDFMAGNYRFTNPGSGSVRNEGLINALGSVALIGSNVQNAGQIIATTVTLAAGNTVAVDLSGDGLIRARVEDAALKASIGNSGSIEGAQVTLTTGQARATLDRIVNNSGIVRATGLSMQGGEIVLEGGRVLNAGTLDAASAVGKGGTVQLLGVEVGVTGTGSIDASGATGGGTILVGGDYQGKHVLSGVEGSPTLQNASFTYLGPQAILKADATQSGDGGKVIVWADDTTRAYGTVTARGGASGGNGGLIETSGRRVLDAVGIRVNASAGAGGTQGQWLLDPSDITITHGSVAGTLISGGIFDPATATGSVTDTDINATLNAGTDVTIQTSAGTGTGAGTIVVNGSADVGGAVAISNTTGGTRGLTLTTAGTITIRSGASIAGSAGHALNVTLNATGGNTIAGMIDNRGGTTALTGVTTLSGTIATGTMTSAASLTGNYGTLDGVTLGGTTLNTRGDFIIYNNLTLANGATVNKGSGTWYFRTTGAQHIATTSRGTSAGAATLNSAGGALYAGYGVTDQTLEVDSGVTVQGYGGFYSSAAAIINAGTINANAAGQSFTISPSTFTNSAGANLNVSGGGILTIAPSSATTAPNWSNAGTINVSSGILNLGGSFTTAGLGSVTRTGGIVNLTGTLDNTLSTLDVGSAGQFGAGGLSNLSGTIKNGTVLSTDATALTSNNYYYGYGSGSLDGVTVGGTTLNTSGEFYIKNNLTLAGGVTVNKGSGTWYFSTTGAQHIATTSGGAATLNSAGGTLYAGYGVAGQTLEVDSGVTVQGYGGFYQSSAAAIVNNGTISANTVGQTFTINPTTLTNNGLLSATAGTLTVNSSTFTNSVTGIANASGGTLDISPNSSTTSPNWSNAGKINVNSGTLNLGGTFTTADLTATSKYSRTAGSAVNLTGTLDLGASTLDVGSAGLFGSGGLTNLSGSIKNGTVLSTDATPTLSSSTYVAALDGVTLGGNLNTRGDFSIYNNLTLANGASVNKGSGTWYFRTTGAQHIATTSGGTSGGAATLNSAGGTLYAGYGVAGQTLEVDSGVTVQGYGGFYQSSAAAIVNNGTLNGNFNLSFNNITNNGVLGGTGTITVGDGTGTLTNNGTIAPGIAGADTTGTLSISGNLVMGTGSHLNIDLSSPLATDYDVLKVSGTATLTGGTLNLSGGSGAGSYPVVTATGELSGTTFATINAGSFIQTPAYSTTSLTLAVTANSNAGIYWDGGENTANWADALNWSNDLAPTSASNLYIGSGAGTVFVTTAGQTANALTSDGSFTLSAGDFTLAGAAIFRGVTNINGGTLTGAGAITLAPGGTLNWTAGTIDATATSTLTTQIGSTANVTGGTLGLNRTWNNSGTLNITPATWTKTGSLNHAAGILNLNGAFATADMFAFNRTGGIVNLTGTLDNSGATLNIGSAGQFGAGGLSNLSGTIKNGTVLSTDATALTSNNYYGYGSGTLDGVTLGGNLNTRGDFSIYNNLTLANGATVNKDSGTWYFSTPGLQHIAMQGGTGTATLNSAGGDIYAYAYSPTTTQSLQIDSGVTLQGYGGFYSSDAALINAGTINANTAGQSFTISPTTFTNSAGANLNVSGGGILTIAPSSATTAPNWSNAGAINVSSGILNLGGSFTTAGLGSVTRTGGIVNLTGTLDNSGATLNIGSAGQFGAGGLSNLSGTIKNGTVLSTDATALTSNNYYYGYYDDYYYGYYGYGSGTLDGVTVGGTTLNTRGEFYIYNNLTLANGATVNKGSGTWYFRTTGAQRIATTSGGTATLNNAGGTLYAGDGVADQTLEIGSGVTVQGYGGFYQSSAAAIVNNGTLNANIVGQTFTISPASFTNNGILNATAGTLTIDPGTFTNSATGIANVSGGTLNISPNSSTTSPNWSNAGKINVNSGTLNLGGTFTTADLTATSKYSRTAGSAVNLTGTLDLGGSTLDVGSAGLFGSGGLTNLSGTIKNGTLLSTDATALTSNYDYGYYDYDYYYGYYGYYGYGSGTLDGVTVGGTTLNTRGDFYIKNNLTLASGVTVNKGSGTWYFSTTGAQHIATTSGGAATLNSAGGALYAGYGVAGQTLEIDSGVTVQGYGGFDQSSAAAIVNNGTLSANTAGQTFTISPSTFTNNGTIKVAAGATFYRAAGFTNAGTLSGSGTISVGTGTSRLVNQGSMNPGGAGEIGTLAITGDLELSTGSMVNMELGGSAPGQFDKLTVSGTVSGNAVGSLGGLTLSKTNGFTFANASGDSFLLLAAASGINTGVFDSFTVARATLTPTYEAGNFSLLLVPKVLTVSADASQSKVYGAADPVLTYTATGFDTTLEDTAAISLSGLLGRASGSNVGLYTFDKGTLVSPLGYAINLTSGSNFSITPASLTVTANNASKTYDSIAYSGGNGVIYTGLVNSDSATSLGGGLTYSGTSQGAINAGSYLITPGGLSSANYNIAYVSGALTINAAPVGVTSLNGTRVYDGTANVSAGIFTLSGLAPGETLTLTGVGTVADPNVGVNKPVTLGSLTLGDGPNGLATNYTFTGGTQIASITSASLAVTANNASKTYDGLGFNGGNGVNYSGFVNGETAAILGGALAYGGTSQGAINAGSYLITPGGLTSDNYNIGYINGVLTIGKANLTLSTGNVSKIYDGGLTALGTAAVTGGTLFNGDSLTGGTFAFTDKNVGSGNKTVTASGVTVNDGNSGDNYSVSYVNNTTSTIHVRPTSNWTGSAGNGLWSSAGNWDALPDGSNVLAVAIPGEASVIYDTAAGSTNLQSITGAGALALSGGTLSIAGNLTTSQYSQTSGVLMGTGSLNVNGSFSQSGGTIALGGLVTISQSAGHLSVGAITAASINLAALSGSINQSAGLATTGLLTTQSMASTLLNDADNRVGSFKAMTTGAGNIELTNVGALDVQNINAASGDVTLINTGGISTSGAVVANNGRVSMTANSPLTIGLAGVSASGDIVLTATNLTSAGNLTLDGKLASSAGAIALSAAHNFVQNSAVTAALGISASAGASMTFGAAATSVGNPVSYTANGVPVSPPEIVKPPSAITDMVAATIQAVLSANTTPVPTLSRPSLDAVAPRLALLTDSDSSEKKDGDSPDKPITLSVTVANSTVQKPADQMVQPVQSSGRSLVCR